MCFGALGTEFSHTDGHTGHFCPPCGNAPEGVSSIPVPLRNECRDGGTGRRGGLKIPWPQGCVGSSPTPGTISFFEGRGGVAWHGWLSFAVNTPLE